MSELTSLQERAAQCYVLEGMTKSDAYRAAYNTENSTDKTVNENASRLFTDSKVSARVEELQRLQLKRQQVTIDRVVAEYAKLAFLDARKAFYSDGSLRPLNEIDEDTAAAIAGLEVVETSIEVDGAADITNRIKKIKLVDKKGALDSLAKFLEMFVTKIEHTGKDGKDLPPSVMVVANNAAIKEAVKNLNEEF